MMKWEYKTLYEEFEFGWTESVTENFVWHKWSGVWGGTCVRNIFRSGESDTAIINYKSFVEKVSSIKDA